MQTKTIATNAPKATPVEKIKSKDQEDQTKEIKSEKKKDLNFYDQVPSNSNLESLLIQNKVNVKQAWTLCDV